MRRTVALLSAILLMLALGIVAVVDYGASQRPATPSVEALTPTHLDPVALVIYKPVQPPKPVCTKATWRSYLKPEERWIDMHESSLDPTNVNDSSGALGLGQLLPRTYAGLGLTPSWSPCREIHAQRAYMRHRYGNWGAAKAFWLDHRWW